ncbi:hypothetical protein P6709_15355 [Jeotgalibacillus sp. ET6]|uniref:hypothetical protein n=1 Tax=Jeotgalibacillus sp. ET6 TaxID=3037260 RepID=UPI002418B1E0|nr:hypothetical protein [Jeotgalibacillus sp. ET6]MDG5473129.1 hypothetical protein [Jeotgalibacillus sp. ET6]
MAADTPDEKKVRPSETSAEDLPDVPVFQDEFTRGFMKSLEEAEPGFYVFESGTKAYELWLPEETIIEEKSYSLEAEGEFETFLATIEHSNKSITQLHATFVNYSEPNLVDRNLDNINLKSKKELDFEKINSKGQTIYLAELERTHDEEYGERFGYIAFVQSPEGVGSLELLYDSFCSEENTNDCGQKLTGEKQKQNILIISSSIKFKGNDENE